MKLLRIFILLQTIYYSHYSLSITFLRFIGNVLASEVDEARMLVDTAERAKRNADNEVSGNKTKYIFV